MDHDPFNETIIEEDVLALSQDFDISDLMDILEPDYLENSVLLDEEGNLADFFGLDEDFMASLEAIEGDGSRLEIPQNDKDDKADQQPSAASGAAADSSSSFADSLPDPWAESGANDDENGDENDDALNFGLEALSADELHTDLENVSAQRDAFAAEKRPAPERRPAAEKRPTPEKTSAPWGAEAEQPSQGYTPAGLLQDYASLGLQLAQGSKADVIARLEARLQQPDYSSPAEAVTALAASPKQDAPEDAPERIVRPARLEKISRSHLHRHFDATSMLEAGDKLKHVLDLAMIPPIVFLGRAVERCLDKLPDHDTVTIAELHDEGLIPSWDMPRNVSFRRVLAARDEAEDARMPQTAAQGNTIVVADVSALELDELILPLEGTHLLLSRLAPFPQQPDHIQGTLMLSGNVGLRSSAAFLQAIKAQLESPITLMV